MRPPELTVAVIAGEQRERAEVCLRHLLSQTALDRIEILIVDLYPGDYALTGADHPRVRQVHRPDLRYYCEAQQAAARLASAPLLALLEDHCYAVPGWAEAILEVFRNPKVSAVNYTMTLAGRDCYLSRSILLTEYGLWMRPHPGGRVRHAASNNAAYRRDLILSQAAAGANAWETEFLLHRALQAAGGEIHVSPEATIAHECWATLGEACRANGAMKRVLGARRAESGGFSLLRRILWAGGMALTPAIFLWRLASSLGQRRALWIPFLAGLPVMCAIYCACAWNEALGYLFGASGSREEFLARELAVKRDA